MRGRVCHVDEHRHDDDDDDDDDDNDDDDDDDGNGQVCVYDGFAFSTPRDEASHSCLGCCRRHMLILGSVVRDRVCHEDELLVDDNDSDDDSGNEDDGDDA